MESWDDDDFEPPVVAPTNSVIANKWEGEDEDDEVKESWEDEDEEKEKEKDKEATQDDVKRPKKKSLAEKVAEKERAKREELARRLKEQEEEEVSPEEKLRRQKESDLKLALETTFGAEEATIDGLSLPTTKEEFTEFSETLSKKLLPLSKSVEYPNFTENLVRNLCATMSSLDIKKIKNTLDNLYLEKQKIEKGEKTKKSKGKGKAKLKLEGENNLSQLSAYVNDYDDFDDFM